MYTLSLHPCRGDIYILPLCPSKCMNSRMRTSDRVHPASTRAWSCAGGSGLQPGLPQSFSTQKSQCPLSCVCHIIPLPCGKPSNNIPSPGIKSKSSQQPTRPYVTQALAAPAPFATSFPPHSTRPARALRALPSAPLPSAHPLPGLLHFLEASAQMSPPQRGLS